MYNKCIGIHIPYSCTTTQSIRIRKITHKSIDRSIHDYEELFTPLETSPRPVKAFRTMNKKNKNKLQNEIPYPLASSAINWQAISKKWNGPETPPIPASFAPAAVALVAEGTEPPAFDAPSS